MKVSRCSSRVNDEPTMVLRLAPPRYLFPVNGDLSSYDALSCKIDCPALLNPGSLSSASPITVMRKSSVLRPVPVTGLQHFIKVANFSLRSCTLRDSIYACRRGASAGPAWSSVTDEREREIDPRRRFGRCPGF